MFGRKVKKTISSVKHLERKRKQKRFRGILAVVFFVSVIIGLSFWSRQSGVVIHQVEVDGTEHVDLSSVKGAVEEAISGSHLFLFPKDNKLLIPRGNVRRELREEFFALRDVSLNVEGPTLHVTVEEHKPAALWCNDPFPEYFIETVEHPLAEEELPEGIEGENDDETEGIIEVSEEPEVMEEQRDLVPKCYFVNGTGLIYMEEPPSHGKDLLKLYNVIDNEPIGNIYISTFFFKTLQDFIQTLKNNLQVDIAEVYSRDNSTFMFVTKEGPRILIDTNDDLVLVADNLATVMEQDAINEAQFSNIEYIDMRFGNRVFYKLR